MARLQEREQIVQLQQIVLHRRGAEQEQVPPLQGVDQPPVLRGAVLAVMGLVDDHQVPGDFGHELSPFAALGKGHRREHAVRILPVFQAVGRAGARRSGELQVELRREFLAPLRHQGRRNQDEHPLGQPPQQVFPQQQTRFDRLAQPHLVGQQHTAREIAAKPCGPSRSDGADVRRR